MTTIVAALFADFDAADAALRALSAAGVPSSDTTRFYLNPGGQHGRFPIGGDEYADPGAKDAGKGALAGAAIGCAAGAALGAAATPAVGPAALVGGLAAGALAGTVAGAMSSLGKGETQPETESRPAGIVVAVQAPTSPDRERAAAIFERYDAHAIEQAEGTWKDGAWQDFDPLSVPKWRKPPVEATGRSS